MTKAQKKGDTLKVIVDAKRMPIPLEKDFHDPAIHRLAVIHIGRRLIGACNSMDCPDWVQQEFGARAELDRAGVGGNKTVDFLVKLRVDELLQELAAEARAIAKKAIDGK